MKNAHIFPASQALQGDMLCPRDKSFSHRAAMVGALAEGKTGVEGFCFCQDTISTLNCLSALGVQIDLFSQEKRVVIQSNGWSSLHEPENILEVGNSGTTIRMLSGIVAGVDGLSILTGDESIRKRPMKRIIEPLRSTGIGMGGRDADRYPPLYIQGKNRLRPFSHRLAVSSAQVKSCLIFAALRGESESYLEEPILSRDHTENMLRYLGARIERWEHRLTVFPAFSLPAKDFCLPGDASSAAFLMAAATLVRGSRVVIEDMGLNPTRTGFLTCLREMGGEVSVTVEDETFQEPRGNVLVESSSLRGMEVTEEMVPGLIDEIPILAVLATQAVGTTVISGAAELRVKESDRLHAIAEGLSRLGADISERPDGLVIQGPVHLRGGRVASYGDHRIAMSLIVAGMVADDEVEVEDMECIGISYPDFFDDLKKIRYSAPKITCEL
ncbi:MAG: 3-phosphoshikimate 1-carboxyvinyltransferase [Candidatus Atribacteria bacterium]|nr:3-phosphoshikimate 1-carboxyvinyltransferase [Candidatus Atribacteria bacterium]